MFWGRENLHLDSSQIDLRGGILRRKSDRERDQNGDCEGDSGEESENGLQSH